MIGFNKQLRFAGSSLIFYYSKNGTFYISDEAVKNVMLPNFGSVKSTTDIDNHKGSVNIYYNNLEDDTSY